MIILGFPIASRSYPPTEASSGGRMPFASGSWGAESSHLTTEPSAVGIRLCGRYSAIHTAGVNEIHSTLASDNKVEFRT